MKKRIKDYIELIFADAPECKRTCEVKEEMYSNVCDRYDDIIREGKSEAVAYNISIAGIGDISDLIEEIRREQSEGASVETVHTEKADGTAASFSPDELEEIKKYRIRAGVMNAVGAALYILCWVPLVLLSLAGDVGAIVGLAVMMLMIAVATGLMILKSSLKPLCLKGRHIDDDEGDDESDTGKRRERKRKNPILSAISTCLWVFTVLFYLMISFATSAWAITWLTFIIAVAIDNIVEAIFEICGKKYM